MTRRTWIKIFCDNWLRGSIRRESLEVRAIFIDLLTMAGDSAYGENGEIKLAEGVGFSDEVIAGILNVPIDIWLKVKKELAHSKDKEERRIIIIQLKQGFSIKIIKWKIYQSEYSRQKQYRDKEEKLQGKLHDGLQTEGEVDVEVDVEVKKKKKKNKDKDKPKKVKYLEFVFLTDKEHQKLVERFGKKLTDEKIETLNNGIGSHGYKYDSHYHTILSWDRKDKKNDDSKKTNTGEIEATNCTKYYGRGNCPFQGTGVVMDYCKYCHRYKKEK